MIFFQLRKLRSDDSALRAKAAVQLGLARSPKAIGPLIEALLDEEQTVRANAAKALDAIDPAWFDRPEAFEKAIAFAVPPLAGGQGVKVCWWYQSEHKVDQKLKALSLMRGGNAAALVQGLWFLNSERDITPETMELIPELMRRKKGDGSISQSLGRFLVHLVADVDDKTQFSESHFTPREIRQAAAQCLLDSVGPSTAIRLLVRALAEQYHKTPDGYIREELTRIDPLWSKSQEARETVPDLMKSIQAYMKDRLKNDPQKFRFNLMLIRDIGTKDSIPVLVPLLELDDPFRDLVIEALNQVDPDWIKSGGTQKEVDYLISSWEKSKSISSLRVLQFIPDSRVMDLMKSALNDPNPNVQKIAAAALVSFHWDPKTGSLREQAVFLAKVRRWSELAKLGDLAARTIQAELAAEMDSSHPLEIVGHRDELIQVAPMLVAARLKQWLTSVPNPGHEWETFWHHDFGKWSKILFSIDPEACIQLLIGCLNHSLYRSEPAIKALTEIVQDSERCHSLKKQHLIEIAGFESIQVAEFREGDNLSLTEHVKTVHPREMVEKAKAELQKRS